MNRYDLQKLSRLRVREAKVLLENKCYDGAYYLLGYAVECALKACIARQTKAFDFPDRKLINDIYTHDLEKLLNASGLKAAHSSECRINPGFQLSWMVVKDWSEQARYMDQVTRQKAKDFRAAVVGRKNGVLPWLQKRW